jgi:hypothetical protein
MALDELAKLALAKADTLAARKSAEECLAAFKETREKARFRAAGARVVTLENREPNAACSFVACRSRLACVIRVGRKSVGASIGGAKADGVRGVEEISPKISKRHSLEAPSAVRRVGGEEACRAAGASTACTTTTATEGADTTTAAAAADANSILQNRRREQQRGRRQEAVRKEHLQPCAHVARLAYKAGELRRGKSTAGGRYSAVVARRGGGDPAALPGDGKTADGARGQGADTHGGGAEAAVRCNVAHSSSAASSIRKKSRDRRRALHGGSSGRHCPKSGPSDGAHSRLGRHGHALAVKRLAKVDGQVRDCSNRAEIAGAKAAGAKAAEAGASAGDGVGAAERKIAADIDAGSTVTSYIKGLNVDTSSSGAGSAGDDDDTEIVAAGEIFIAVVVLQ